MNTLRLLKGKDITIYVDDTVLCFVTDFVSHESSKLYKVEEMLSDSEFDSFEYDNSYELSITALSHLKTAAFDKESFTIRVVDGETTYEYSSCKLIKKERIIKPSDPVADKYTIVAQQMRVLEGAYD